MKLSKCFLVLVFLGSLLCRNSFAATAGCFNPTEDVIQRPFMSLETQNENFKLAVDIPVLIYGGCKVLMQCVAFSGLAAGIEKVSSIIFPDSEKKECSAEYAQEAQAAADRMVKRMAPLIQRITGRVEKG